MTERLNGSMLIDGELRDSVSRTKLSTVNPATGMLLAEVPRATDEDVNRATQAAARAAPEWSSLTPWERASYLRELAAAISDRAEEYALLDTLDSGNPLRAMREDVRRTVRSLEFYASLAGSLSGDTIPASRDHLHYTVRVPFGVVARIVPYNHPFLFAATRLAAPLLAGNTVIMKPAPQTPLSALRLGEILQDVFPPGVVGVVTGGAPTGEALVRHPAVRHIGVIGSLRTGLAVQAAAAASGHVKEINFELGGKNALVLFPDVDLETAADAVVRGMNLERCQGQSCGSTSRVFVHDDIRVEVVERVVERFERMRLGDPVRDDTDMGPLISGEHLERVISFVRTAQREGARLVTGGEPLEGDGYFMPPTAFDDVVPDSTLDQEEVFGPVVAFVGWNDYETMIAAANGTQYGLTASIWTSDLRLAHLTATRLVAGYVWVNTVEHRWPGVPWGGLRDSGLGREYSAEEILAYTQTKAVNVHLDSPSDGSSGH